MSLSQTGEDMLHSSLCFSVDAPNVYARKISPVCVFGADVSPPKNWLSPKILDCTNRIVPIDEKKCRVPSPSLALGIALDRI